MPIQIQSQSQMRLAREAVQFCYLCGQPLSLVSPSEVASEHVLARGSSDLQVTGADAWNVTLPVHRTCDVTLKKPHDDELISLQRVHCRPLHKVGNSDRKRVWKRMAQAEREGLPRTFPAVSTESTLKAVWATVRGMHAALYSAYLPPDVKHRTMPPVPSFSTKSTLSFQQQVEDEALTGTRVLRGVEGALLANECDEIKAWGFSIRYRCIWHVLPDRNNAMCIWSLETPEAGVWSRSVTGGYVPWRGLYFCAQVPRGAAMLSDRAIELANADTERKAHKPIIMFLTDNAGRIPQL